MLSEITADWPTLVAAGTLVAIAARIAWLASDVRKEARDGTATAKEVKTSLERLEGQLAQDMRLMERQLVDHDYRIKGHDAELERIRRKLPGSRVYDLSKGAEERHEKGE